MKTLKNTPYHRDYAEDFCQFTNLTGLSLDYRPDSQTLLMGCHLNKDYRIATFSVPNSPAHPLLWVRQLVGLEIISSACNPDEIIEGFYVPCTPKITLFQTLPAHEPG